MMKIPTLTVCVLSGLLISCGGGGSDDNSSASTPTVPDPPSTPTNPNPPSSNSAPYVISQTVINDHVEAVGANLTTLMGGTNLTINNLMWGSGMEPIVWRQLTRALRVGDDWVEWDFDGGPGHWNLAWDGYGDGATVKVYRLADANGQALDFTNLGSMLNVDSATQVQFVGETRVSNWQVSGADGKGDPAGQRVYFADNLSLRIGDYLFFEKTTEQMPRSTSHPDLQQHWEGNLGPFNDTTRNYDARYVSHPQPLPSNFTDAGRSCLRIDNPQNDWVRFGQYLFHPYDDGEGQWYTVMEPGQQYRVSVWLRYQNTDDAAATLPVQFGFAGGNEGINTNWQVTDEWQQFSFEFTAPEAPTSGGHIAPTLSYTTDASHSQLYLDNWVLSRTDAPQFGRHPVAWNILEQALPHEGLPPAIRFYPLTYGDPSIASQLGNYADTGYRLGWNAGDEGAEVGATIAQMLNWSLQSGDSPNTRVIPYITFQEEYTEDEWQALIEYLGVPFYPGVDTQASKPYAYQRYLFRDNNGAPWTDEFREIMIEYGNETWHNGAGGYGWDGFGPAGYVHFGGKEYGLFARYMFKQHVQQMPEWSAFNLASKIKLVLGANYDAHTDAYGELAVQQLAPGDVSYLGHANYVGPKWETEDAGRSEFSHKGLQETAVGMVTSMQWLLDQAKASRDQLGGYQLVAYEGGPSGYWSNQDDPDTSEDESFVDEQYGKSAAMGLAALDAWLYSSQSGYSQQSFLGFSAGRNWTSHRRVASNEYRPHSGWLTLTLRNQCNGREMLAVTPPAEQASLTWHGPDQYDQPTTLTIPRLGVYAIKTASDLCVFVLNRNLGGTYDGQNLGDGSEAVALQLPISSATAIELSYLAAPNGDFADPAANNIDSEQLLLQQQSLSTNTLGSDGSFIINSATGATANGLPAGAVTLYRFKQVSWQ